mgnify:CR=1 FL=1
MLKIAQGFVTKIEKTNPCIDCNILLQSGDQAYDHPNPQKTNAKQNLYKTNRFCFSSVSEIVIMKYKVVSVFT